MSISAKEQMELRKRGNYFLDSAKRAYSRNDIEEMLGFVIKLSEVLPKDPRISKLLMRSYSELQAKGDEDKAEKVAKKMLELDCFHTDILSKKISKKYLKIKILIFGSFGILLLAFFFYGISRFIFVFTELSKLDI